MSKVVVAAGVGVKLESSSEQRSCQRGIGGEIKALCSRSTAMTKARSGDLRRRAWMAKDVAQLRRSKHANAQHIIIVGPQDANRGVVPASNAAPPAPAMYVLRMCYTRWGLIVRLDRCLSPDLIQNLQALCYRSALSPHTPGLTGLSSNG